jgi:hypothetical protein
MTSPRATTLSNQEAGQHSPTDSSTLAPPRPAAARAPSTVAMSGRIPWAPTLTGQPQPGTSTWSTRPAQAQPTGSRRVTGLDKWEGKILEIDGDTFTAELYPIDREGMPITADFDLELLGSDIAIAAQGDVFYLAVRTVKAPGMRPIRTENLRLRRLGRITPEEVQAMYVKADALMERLEQLFD